MSTKLQNGNKRELDLLSELRKLYHEVAILGIKLDSVEETAAEYKQRAAKNEKKFKLQKAINADLRKEQA